METAENGEEFEPNVANFLLDRAMIDSCTKPRLSNNQCSCGVFVSTRYGAVRAVAMAPGAVSKAVLQRQIFAQSVPLGSSKDGGHVRTPSPIYSRMNLLLLLCFISYSGSSSKPVSGIKGGNISLSCGSEDREIVDIRLYSWGKPISVCVKKNCRGRVFKEGSCDVIITDLIYSDAGKYFLYVYYTNDQSEVEREILEYHLHIHDEISVKKGEDLKLAVLLINADKVERNSGSGWTELWTRGHGVNSDRLTVSNETLIIHEFTDTDTGTYRVLDSNNQTWITVTVTESILVSKRNLSDTDEDKTDDTEHGNYWIFGLTVVLGVLVLLGLRVLAAGVIFRRHREGERFPVFRLT